MDEPSTGHEHPKFNKRTDDQGRSLFIARCDAVYLRFVNLGLMIIRRRRHIPEGKIKRPSGLSINRSLKEDLC